MKPWVKRTVICAAVAVPLVVFPTIERTRGRRGLERVLAGMRARGEELSIERLEPAMPSREENGFNELTDPQADVNGSLNRAFECPPLLKYTTNAHVVTMRQIQVWNVDIKTTRDWNQTGSLVDDSSELLSDIRAAVRKPAYRNSFDYRNWSSGTPLRWLSEIKKTAQLLGTATLYDLHRGKNDPASERLLDLLQLVAAQNTERLVIGQIVRNACASIAFSVTWQALQVPGWTDAQLAAWQAAWSAFDPAHDFVAALEMDRAEKYDYFKRIRESPDKLAAALEEREQADRGAGSGPESLPTHGLLLNDIHVPLWRIAWADQDETKAMEEISRAIDRARLALTNSWMAVPDPSLGDDGVFLSLKGGNGPRSGYDRLRFLFSAGMFGVTDKTILRAVCVLTERRLAITAIAIARYRLKHGALPADLPGLVPEFLAGVPRDGMDGKPLRYRPLPNNQFILYSVGFDRKDGGGDSALRPGKEHYSTIWDANDAIWPAAASDGEAAAAEVAKKKPGG